MRQLSFYQTFMERARSPLKRCGNELKARERRTRFQVDEVPERAGEVDSPLRQEVNLIHRDRHGRVRFVEVTFWTGMPVLRTTRTME